MFVPFGLQIDEGLCMQILQLSALSAFIDMRQNRLKFDYLDLWCAASLFCHIPIANYI